MPVILKLPVALAILSVLACSDAFSKHSVFQLVQEDSTIVLQGYVYDSTSNQGNHLPLQAKIVLESLPYGSEIGIISTKDTTGYFEYYLNPAHSYKLDIKCEGYRPHMEILNPKEGNGSVLAKKFFLKPGLKADQVIRLENLIFDQGKAIINPESYTELNQLAATMRDNDEMEIQLEGHTDWRGNKKLNMRLSEDRVEAVKNYLVTMGIDKKRIRTKAFGGSQPITKEKSLEASEVNRRVEVRILKIE